MDLKFLITQNFSQMPKIQSLSADFFLVTSYVLRIYSASLYPASKMAKIRGSDLKPLQSEDPWKSGIWCPNV